MSSAAKAIAGLLMFGCMLALTLAYFGNSLVLKLCALPVLIFIWFVVYDVVFNR
jgi:hypothetical protein